MQVQSLAAALPYQQERCRAILETVLSIGPAGTFLAANLRHDLKRAELAAASGDTVAMLKAHAALAEYQE